MTVCMMRVDECAEPSGAAVSRVACVCARGEHPCTMVRPGRERTAEGPRALRVARRRARAVAPHLRSAFWALALALGALAARALCAVCTPVSQSSATWTTSCVLPRLGCTSSWSYFSGRPPCRGIKQPRGAYNSSITDRITAIVRYSVHRSFTLVDALALSPGAADRRVRVVDTATKGSSGRALLSGPMHPSHAKPHGCSDSLNTRLIALPAPAAPIPSAACGSSLRC